MKKSLVIFFCLVACKYGIAGGDSTNAGTSIGIRLSAGYIDRLNLFVLHPGFEMNFKKRHQVYFETVLPASNPSDPIRTSLWNVTGGYSLYFRNASWKLSPYVTGDLNIGQYTYYIYGLSDYAYPGIVLPATGIYDSFYLTARLGWGLQTNEMKNFSFKCCLLLEKPLYYSDAATALSQVIRPEICLGLCYKLIKFKCKN